MSLRGQFAYFLVKNRHLFSFRLKPEAWDESTSVLAYRAWTQAFTLRTANQLPPGLVVEPFELAGMRAEWLLPAGARKSPVILYLVGGGYVSGNCNDHRTMVAKVAQASGIATLMFDHRLAPENPFPAALEDTLAAYRWLLDLGVGPESIIIMGESAGGGLCLAALLALRDQGLPLPAAGVAFSPWTDLALTGASYQTKAKACISPPGMSAVCSKYYVGDHDPMEPWISPLYGDLHGLPPLFINAGENETLLDDSTRFAAKAKQAGVETTLLVGHKMFHCYALLAPMFPEATQAMQAVCRFIQKNLAR